MLTNSLYSIDSLLLDIYKDMLPDETEEERQRSVKILEEIISLYEPYIDTKLDEKTWWKTPFKKIFKIRSLCPFSGDKDNGYISFDKDQDFYVLNVNEKEEYYIVTDNKQAPFSDYSISGKVPCYYFKKLSFFYN
jgi:hypothetical protein